MRFENRCEAETAVLDFFKGYFKDLPDRIDLETRIVRDLGVAGDDGDDLLLAFESRFGVPASGYVGWHEFGSEGGPDPVTMVMLLTDYVKSRRRGVRRNPVVVSDFVDAAYAGKWGE